MKSIAVCISMIWLAAGPFAFAQYSKTITFDDLWTASGTAPKVQIRYSNDGIIILNKSALLYDLVKAKHKSNPASSPNVLLSRSLSSEWDNESLYIQFTTGVQSVELYTGVPGDPKGITIQLLLEAYDINNQMIQRDSKTFNYQTDINKPLLVAAPGSQPIIYKIKIDVRQQSQTAKTGLFELVDNLTFRSESAPPKQAVEPPKVKIVKPVATKTNNPNINISGEIIGTGIFPEVNPPVISLDWNNAPGSTLVSSSDYDLELNKSLYWAQYNQALSFSYPYQLEYFGVNTVKVTACNAKGSDADQKSITYFPVEIENEFTAKGGASSYGSFVWGTTISGCMFSVYQNGAIFVSTNGTFSCFGKIFNRWKSLATGSGFGLLGCAISAEKTVKGGSYQDFSNGRIYTGVNGTYYVSEPFITAIDKLDFVTQFGLPAGDPSWPSSATGLYPVQWQKFSTIVSGISFLSTMEITEDAKTKELLLWTAAPDFSGAKKAGVTPSLRTPTIWTSYPCTKTGSKIGATVSKAVDKAKTPYTDLQKACKYGHFVTNLSGVPEWVTMAANEIVPAIGTVASSHLAGEDTWETHSCSLCGAQTPGWCFAGVDWCIKIYPEADYTDLLGETTYTAKHTVGVYPQDDLEIEYEYCVVGYPPPVDATDMSKGGQEGYIQLGDRLYVAGRWVTDCGCHPSFGAAPIDWCKDRYKTEIHPPAAMINMYTGKTSTGDKATLGDLLYFDWWYTGESVTVNVFPPPRPQADAILGYSYPLWKSFCSTDAGKCGAAYSAAPNGAMNHVTVTLTGRSDVAFNTPPQEESNGQLIHGYVPPAGSQHYVPSGNWPHTKSLLGTIEVYWNTTP